MPVKLEIDETKFEHGQKKRVKKIFHKNRRKYWLFKRLVDIVLSSLAIVFFSPVLVLIALIVFIDDPHGSPIFKQIRVGRHFEGFKIYKFRTMIIGADKMVDELQELNETDGPAFKIKDDPRITKVGKFLRKYSLDELPQLFNVLKGDMTIVGPRPALPNEVAQYDDYQKLRLLVTPGLTCDWQIQPSRNDITFDDWMHLDIGYIGERSLKKDIILIFKTIKIMFTGEGR